ncbi:MAG: DASS family sodium-coupled anion symporter [Blastocatellia bacterium]|nr:DASS family sodium-coupled anion symporter [Blastocatellia bacterium]
MPENELLVEETITQAEARFEKMRKRVGLLLAPLTFLSVYLIPTPSLSNEGHKLAAILASVVVLWITEALPLPVTGLLGPALVVILGVSTAAKAFAPFADPIMFLFLGAFILSRSIHLHKLDKRFAYWVLSRPLVGESPSRILFAYGGVCCFISMWISNTATVAMMFPIGLAIIDALKQIRKDKLGSHYPTALMLICTFGASIGGLATPVGTPPNLIGLGFIERQLGRQVRFFEWMTFGLPVVVTLYLLLFLYLNLFSSPGTKKMEGVAKLIEEKKRSLGTMTRGEINTMLAFGLTVLLWITPGILALVLGDSHPLTNSYTKHFPESVAALIGACLLFLLPVNLKKEEFTLNVKQAFSIDWGVMALYGGGIALGQMAFETKLAETIGKGLTTFIPASGTGLLASVAIVATLTSELTSNVSSANMVVPVVIAIAGQNGLQAAIAACMASSLGFMLPISTPTNAIAYSSGYVPITKMIKYGLILDLIGFVVILIGTLFLVPTK